MRYYPPRYLLRRHVVLREILPGGAFVEVGPGEYALSRELASKFERGTLIEFHHESNELYEKNLSPEQRVRISLIEGDFNQIAHDKLYDCFVACEVLEHVADDRLFMSNARKALRDGGQLVLSVPAHMRFWSRHDDSVGHLRRYEKDELVSLLEVTGFSGIKVLSYGYPVINLLRYLRVLKDIIFRPPEERSDKTKTQLSGIRHLSQTWQWLGLIINPLTFLPLNILSEYFESFDMSEGYVVVATACTEKKGECNRPL